MSRRRKAVVGILGAVVVAFALPIILFDWSWFKGPIESLASSQLERRVELAGDIDGELSLTPRFWLEDVRVANASWGSDPRMLSLDRLTFEIDLLELLDGRLVLPMVALDAPEVLVERNGDGRINWQLGGGQEPAGAMPAIGEISVRDARIRYRGPETEREVMVSLDTLQGTGGMARDPVKLEGAGALAELPLELDLEAGALNDLQDGELYPVDVTLHVGETSAAIKGSIQEPASFEAADLTVRLESPDPTPILAAAGLGTAPAPPISLSARVLQAREVWSVQDLEAQVGDSNLSGRAGVDLAEEPALIEADLRSDRFDVQALQELYERLVPASVSDDQEETQPIWTPEEGLDLDLLPDLQLDVALDARDVTAEDLHLGELHLNATLRNRMPRLQLSAQGRYQGEPLVIEASAGSETATTGPYRLDGRLEVGANTARLSGRMSEPLALAGLDVGFDLDSPQPSTLFELLSLPAPEIPDLMLSGRLKHEGTLWQLDDVDARLGESDLGGSVTLDLAGPTPSLSADLHSDRVNIADLQRLMGPQTEAATEAVAEEAVEELPVPAPAAGPEQPLITLDGVNRSALPDWQAEIDYSVGRLSGPELEIRDAELHGRLRDQVVVAALSGTGEVEGEPLRFDLQLGRTNGGGADEAGYPIEAHLEAGETTADLEGRLAEPMRFRDATVSFELVSPNPNRWPALLGLAAPEIPPIRAAMGELVREGPRWRLPDAYLEVGESNLFGSVLLDLGGERPLIEAELRSNRLTYQDLVPEQEAAEPEAAQQEAAEQQAAPEQPAAGPIPGFSLEALPAVDATITLDAEYVHMPPDILLQPLSADLQLRNRIPVLDLSGEGMYGLSPLTVEAHLGATENLEDPSARYPVEISVNSEVTAARVSGSVADPLTFSDPDIDVLLEGPDLEQLGTILQLGLPSTPPYRLSGNITHGGRQWRLASLDGRIGDSDVQGSATVDLAADRRTIVAELRSDRLDLDDLGPLIGATPEVEAGETASEQQAREAAQETNTPDVLPDEPFDLPDFRVIDARVQYQAQDVLAGGVPITGMELGGRLEDGILTIEPLRFEVGQGTLASTMTLDARDSPIGAEIDLGIRELNLKVLLEQLDIDLPQVEGEENGRGTMSGQAKLEGRGNSVAQIAGSLDGRLAVVSDGGRINAMLVEASGLDIAEILAILVAGGEEGQDMVPIRCLVIDMPISQGTARLDPLVLDTTDSTVFGWGTIDLGAETLDLQIASSPKDVSILSANVPVQVSGSFSGVDIVPLAQEILDKGLVDLGLTEDAPCQSLIEEVRRKLKEETAGPSEER